MATYGVVLVTVDTQEAAQSIAEEVVRDRLAACVNIFPIHSIYRWQGDIQRDSEWQLVIKTDLAQFSALETKLTAIHPYEVPEMLALPVQQGATPYLSWMAAQLTEPPAETLPGRTSQA